MEGRRKNHVQGGILIVALVVCAMGAIGITAWVSVLNARSGQVNAIELAAARHIRAANGLAAAKEYFYRDVVTKTAGAAHAETLPGGWGSFSLGAWGGGTALSSADAGVINQFSPSTYGMGSVSTYRWFSEDYTFTISDGVSNLNHTFRVRSGSPLVAGDLLTLHTPTLTPAATNTITGNINVDGRAVIWTPEPGSNIDDLDAVRYVSPDVASSTLLLDNPGGGVVLPLNYPLTPTTNGEFGGHAYNGELNVVAGTTADNSMLVKLGTPMIVDGDVSLAWTNGVSSNGFGRVYFDLDDPALGNVEVRNAFRIYFYGQTSAAQATAAAGLSPVSIVLVRSNVAQRDLFSFRIFDRNSRPLNVGIKKSVGGTELWCYFYDSDINPVWRMMLTLENTPVRFINMYGGTISFQGGLRTDRAVRHSGWYTVPGAFDIVRETASGPPVNFDLNDLRTAWVESYWQ